MILNLRSSLPAKVLSPRSNTSGRVYCWSTTSLLVQVSQNLLLYNWSWVITLILYLVFMFIRTQQTFSCDFETLWLAVVFNRNVHDWLLFSALKEIWHNVHRYNCNWYCEFIVNFTSIATVVINLITSVRIWISSFWQFFFSQAFDILSWYRGIIYIKHLKMYYVYTS